MQYWIDSGGLIGFNAEYYRFRCGDVCGSWSGSFWPKGEAHQDSNPDILTSAFSYLEGIIRNTIREYDLIIIILHVLERLLIYNLVETSKNHQ